MAYSTLLVRFVLLYTALCSLVDAQLIPRRPPGVTLGNGSVTLVSNSSPIGRFLEQGINQFQPYSSGCKDQISGSEDVSMGSQM
ncbi:hypothetical protein DD237_006256 [Peronospora effusa]|uniref:RxLR effector candidate protein n=1 Tax=Peronospora effusa TaxID=542832 RepID=A0A3R8CTP4_9STRA|nr:hypothetical protein DD237_006256 [Peronospora effusa]